MTQKNNARCRFTLVVMLMLCSVSAVEAQSRRFHGRKEYLPYTRNLQPIDKIELLKLKLNGDLWEGGFEGSKFLTGARAQRLARLWRAQNYNSHLGACHNPAYAIKFYSKGKLLAYASVCWSCNNIYMITPELKISQSFAGYDKKGEQLSDVFERAFAK